MGRCLEGKLAGLNVEGTHWMCIGNLEDIMDDASEQSKAAWCGANTLELKEVMAKKVEELSVIRQKVCWSSLDANLRDLTAAKSSADCWFWRNLMGID